MIYDTCTRQQSLIPRDHSGKDFLPIWKRSVSIHVLIRKEKSLAQQGAVCNRLVILTKGSVRGEMIDYSGRLIKVEDIAAPRAIAPLFLFGEENRYPVEVTANEPTEVIELPKSSVLSLFRKNEQFLENYMNLSANYARTLSDKLFLYVV